MDPNAETLYCAEQIKIPGELPDILKEFTKAAIRTQPPDLIIWSAAYFEALRVGETPPVKTRLEKHLLSPQSRSGGLSKGSLAVLHKQLGSEELVPVDTLKQKWDNTGCQQSKLTELLRIGNFDDDDIEWKKLLALSCTALEKTLSGALKVMCEILSPDLEGGPARIELGLFEELYNFLASVDGEIPTSQVQEVMEFLTEESNRYGGRVGPREFFHELCPRLDSRLPSAIR